jgi:hypothetical protein
MSRGLIKSYLGGITVTMMTLLLLYNVKDYPCLRGAGLAMADSEAFLLAVFIAIPCLVWAIRRVLFRQSPEQPCGDRLINYMALFAISGVTIFLALAIALIFFTSKFPLQFICEQPYLTWLFKYPM